MLKRKLSPDVQLHQSSSKDDRDIEVAEQCVKKLKDEGSHEESEEDEDFTELFEFNDLLQIVFRTEDFKVNCQKFLSLKLILRFFQCLGEQNLITNVALYFYLDHVFHNYFTEEQKSKVHILRPDFYTVYATNSNFAGWKNVVGNASEKRYERVASMADIQVNIFEKDFIVVPCLEKEHWFLIIICYPGLSCERDEKENQQQNIVAKVETNEKALDSRILKAPVILCFDSVAGRYSSRSKAIKHVANFLTEYFKNRFRDQQLDFDAPRLATRHVPVLSLTSNFTNNSNPSFITESSTKQQLRLRPFRNGILRTFFHQEANLRFRKLQFD